MRDHGLSRRVLLRGAAAGSAAVIASAGCSEQRPPAVAPPKPDPDTVLLRELIAGKERLIGLYRQAASAAPRLAAALRPFERRHQAHLAELRRRLPPDAQAQAGGADAQDGPDGAPSPSASGAGAPAESTVATAGPGDEGAGGASSDGSPEPTPSASTQVVTVTRLRAAERAAAASRPKQLATASPALAQLVACIGACEAAHVIALPTGST